jgi:hypothetical protein
MNFETNNISAAPAVSAEYLAVSARDYRGGALPSPFGAEAKGFNEIESARKWLESLKHGGELKVWSGEKKEYLPFETVEPKAKAVAK